MYPVCFVTDVSACAGSGHRAPAFGSIKSRPQTGASSAASSGASFVADRNQFGGLLDPTGAVLEFYYDPYYYSAGAPLAEIIQEATYLVSDSFSELTTDRWPLTTVITGH